MIYSCYTFNEENGEIETVALPEAKTELTECLFIYNQGDNINLAVGECPLIGNPKLDPKDILSSVEQALEKKHIVVIRHLALVKETD
jgi:hypothetical protein